LGSIIGLVFEIIWNMKFKWWAITLIWLAGFYWLAFFSTDIFWGYIPNNDFYDYYVGAKLVSEGKSPYGITEDWKDMAQNRLKLNFNWATGYSYPPFLAVLIQPLLLLNPYAAAMVWLGLNIMSYGWFIAKILHRFKTNQKWIAYWAWFSAPVLGSLVVGQVNMWAMLALFYYIFSNDENKKAVGLAVAIMLKVYPVYFVFLEIWHKNWKLLGKLAGALILLNLITLPFNGLKLNYQYVTAVLPALNNNFDGYFFNQSVNGLVSRLLTSTDRFRAIVDDSTMKSINWAVALAGIIGLFILTKNMKPGVVKKLYWLTLILVLAGKNNYINLAPMVIVGAYLIDQWPKLDKISRILVVDGYLLSLLVFGGSYFWEMELMPISWIQRIGYAVATSTGLGWVVGNLVILGRLGAGTEAERANPAK
jgi:hypothetical protein